MTESYVIAGIIVIICITAIIFSIRALKETRDLQSPIKDPDNHRDEDDFTSIKSKRLY